MADPAAYPSVISLGLGVLRPATWATPRQQQVVLGHRDETIAHAGIVLAGVELCPVRL